MAQKGDNYEVVREGEEIILRLDYSQMAEIPSLEDSPICMSRIIDFITEVGRVTKIVFSQKRDYEYDYTQTSILIEIAKIYETLVKEKISFQDLYEPECPSAQTCAVTRYAEIQKIIYRLLKSDPLGAYVELKRIFRRETIKSEELEKSYQKCQKKYLLFLDGLLARLEKTRLIKIAKPDLPGYAVGDRSIYRKIFVPIIKPDFMYTKVISAYPIEGEEIGSYSVNDAEITVFKMPESVITKYHLIPPEFRLTEEKYMLLDTARKIMAEHKPTKTEFTDPQRMRSVFYNIGSDLIEELAGHYNIKLSLKDLEQLAQILVRYTVGFGLIEVLLADDKVQDITVNAPMGRTPIFIVHGDYGDCVTNIIPTVTEAESWASKLRMISGRPLDEANPILDTGLVLPHATARVAVISPPLNPYGLAYAFRRHRDKPWTLPLFIKYRMVNSMGAGLLSFLVDGARTILVAGTRSAGKTSFLTSLLVEIMRRYRIITIEDTLELPTNSLRQLGYNIQSMKVASAMTRGTAEVSASEGIRTTLRLGDSSLIVGEVRSDEARSLYEAMRVGALANVVAGTIHGDSPYGVFDRVVNDLNVPRTSFKATDIIVVANPIRSPDGLHRWRRITQITEVRKHWETDPLAEGGFVDLMKYDAKTDSLQPTPDLMNGDSDILKSIGGSVREWAGDWDAIWENIILRADIKQTLVNVAEQSGKPEILEAEFMMRSNDEFHRISDEVREEVGMLDSKKILFRWKEWIKKALRKKEFESHG